MSDWNNETDSIVRECKLRTLKSKWNKASRGARQPVQQPSESDRGEDRSESTNHCDERIVEHSVATQDIET